MSKNMLYVGWRLLIGKQGGLGQTVLMAVGIGIAVALLTAVSAIPAAIEQRQARDSYREWLLGGEQVQASSDIDVIAVGNDRFGAQQLTHLLVGSTGAVRLGSLDLEPGDVLISPALAHALEVDPSLAERFQGQIKGTLPPDLLVAPDEMLSVAHQSPERVTASGQARALPAGEPPTARDQIPAAIALAAGMACLTLALPVAVFLIAATRFGIERRRARVRTLSLAGADSRQLRSVWMLETVSAALVGLPLGVMLFWLARPLLAKIEIGGRSNFVEALHPSPLAISAISLAVLGGSFVAALVGTRRLGQPPSSTRHQSKTSWLGLLIMGIGLAGLAVGAGSPTHTDAPNPLALLGLIVLSIGFALSGKIFVSGIGNLLRRTSDGVTLLASAQMRRASGETSRPLVAVATAVLMVAAFFTITGTLIRSSNPRLDNLDADLLVADVDRRTASSVIEQVEGQSGVEASVVLGLATAESPDGSTTGPAVIADCAEVRKVFLDVIEACDDGVFLSPEAAAGVGGEILIAVPSAPGSRIEAPVGHAAGSLRAGFPATVLVDESAMPREFVKSIPRSQVVIRIDPRATTPDAVRTLVVSQLPTAWVRSAAEIEDEFSAPAREVRTLATIGLSIVIVVAIFGLAVSTASQLLQRRSAYKLLRASGLQGTQVRNLVAFNILVPMGLIAAAAAILGSLAGAAVVTSGGGLPVIPWSNLALIYAGALIASLAVWLGFAPTVDRLTSPTGLRFE